MRPVAVADPVVGEEPVLVAARERAGRLQANRIINSSRAAWIKMQADYKAEFADSRERLK